MATQTTPVAPMDRQEHGRLLTIAITAARAAAWGPSEEALDAERQTLAEYNEFCRSHGETPYDVRVVS